MEPALQLTTFRKNIDSIIAGIIGFCVIQLFTRHSGIGISPDSITYLSAARNLRAGHGLVQFDQFPMIDFPAGYPVLLTTIMVITGHDILPVAPISNGLLFFVLIYVAGSIMNGFKNTSKLYKACLLLCVALSPALLEVYTMIWSETIFLLLVLFFLTAAFKYVLTGSNNALIGMTIICAVACVIRYAAVTLVLSGMIVVIANTKFMSRRMIRHLIVFTAGSITLLVVNLTRNHLLGNTLTGIREKGNTGFSTNLTYIGSVYCDWLPLPKGNDQWAVITASVIIILLSLMLVRNFTRRRMSAIEDILILFCWIYTFFILFSSTVLRYEQINSRLLVPSFIPLIWSLSYCITDLAKTAKRNLRILIIIIGLLIFGSFQKNQYNLNWETYDGVKDAGIPGYTEDQWTQSPTVQYLRKHDFIFNQGKAVYANANDAVYFFTGKLCNLLPHKEFSWQVDIFLKEKHFFLIWFNDGENNDLLSLDYILKEKKPVIYQQFADGVIYTDGNP